MLKLFDQIISLISYIVMLGLLGSYTASYINPNTFILPSLLGLAYPYLLISNIILLFFWIFRWKKIAWMVLIVILIGLPTFLSYFGTGNSTHLPQQNKLSLLSYNVRYFDYYNWSKQKDTKTKLLNYLREFSGDIICLQEFTLNTEGEDNHYLLKHLNSYSHHHIRKGMAILSKYPILNKGQLAFGEKSSGSCIYCDIQTPLGTIRLYNIHLESFKLGKEERLFMKEISQRLTNHEFAGAKKLTSRLITGNKNRAKQADKIKKHIQQAPHCVILCGDFNDTPLSYTYQEIKTELKDAFIEKGRGLGHTYIGEFPSFRIDYILHSPQLETTMYQRDLIELSDHYPIQATLTYKTP